MAATQRSSGRDAMALLAARLMGGGGGGGGASAATYPSHQTTTSTTPSWPSTSAAASAPIPRTMPNPSAPTSQVQQPPPSASSGSSNRDINFTAPPGNTGPSLRGNEEQLQAARDFALTATSGGQKGRNGSGSRSRQLSQEPSHAGRSSAAPYASQTLPSPRPRPSTAGVGASNGVPAGISKWQQVSDMSTAAVSSPTIKREDATVSATAKPNLTGQQSLPKFEPTPAPSQDAAASPVLKKEAPSPARSETTTKLSGKGSVGIAQAAAPVWPFQNITNILKDRAADTLPPHLRGKGQGKAQSQVTPASVTSFTTPEIKQIVTDPVSETAPKKAATAPPVETTSAGQPAAVAVSPAVNGNASTTQPATGSSKVDQVAEKEPLTNGTSSPSDSAAADINSMFSELKQEVAAIKKRMSALEEETFTLQKEMEIVKQTEERRKFLGTDSAKAPFGVDVKGPNGKVIRVQARTGLKVGEFIRRIRTTANLRDADSKEPRVSFEDQQLGHGITLGEAGVGPDSILVFFYIA